MMGIRRLKTDVQAGAMTTVHTELVTYLLTGTAPCRSVSVRAQFWVLFSKRDFWKSQTCTKTPKGYHGKTCSIPDCPAVGGIECPDHHHCEPNSLRPGKPNCVCNDDFCECPENYCHGHGICQAQRYTDGLAKFVCDCFSSYYGETCADSCNSTSCENGGNCLVSTDSVSKSCSCPYGWEGRKCERKKSCQVHTDLCLNEAICSDTGHCICWPGFEGEFCEYTNACFGQVCQQNSVCQLWLH